MLLARRAGEKGGGSNAVSPASGQAGEPAAQEVAGEVLVGDADLTAGPAFSQPTKVRKQGVSKHGLYGVVAEQLSSAACAAGSSKLSRASASASAAARRPTGEAPSAMPACEVLGTSASAARAASADDRPARDKHLHPADPGLVSGRVQPQEPAVGSDRDGQAVPAFPGTKHVLADPQSAAELADAQSAPPVARSCPRFYRP